MFFLYSKMASLPWVLVLAVLVTAVNSGLLGIGERGTSSCAPLFNPISLTVAPDQRFVSSQTPQD